MIKHVYLLKLVDKSMADDVINKVLELKENTPSVKDVEMYKDFRGTDKSYDLIEIVTCETMEDFESFTNDPFHQKVREYNADKISHSIKVDYEC